MDLGSYVESDRERLVGLAYLLLGSPSDAEDAVQSALLRLSTSRLSHVVDLPSYVRRAVVNECASWKRSQIRRRRVEQQLEEPVGDAEPIAVIDLGRALQSLSSKHRSAVVLRYYLDLDDASIGQILGCAPATVRSRLSRALRKLRVELGDA